MEAGHPVVPYVPFKTFLTALDALEAGLPNQLDRSVWPSYSGAIQGQLLGAFRFLGLMDEGNCPTPALADLVSKRGARRELLRGLIERHYRTFVALDLTRTSPRQLDEALRQYGLSGATHKKAFSFFLQAAQFAGMPLSVLLKAKTRTAAFGRKRAATSTAVSETPGAPLSKTVRLRSGGTLTVAASLDLFSLAGEDRKLVFDLIDRLQEYEGR